MRFAALLLAAALAACGGGGGSAPVTGTITPAAPPRAGILFGYFGGVSANVVEVADHVNLYFAGAWDPLEQMATLMHAKGAGIRNVILVLPAYFDGGGPKPESELRFWLQRLKTAGELDNIVATYPIDEPDTVREGNRSDAEVTAQNAIIRRVLADFGLPSTLAVIYACDTGRQPGFASYDWIGCDHYPSGCGVLTKYIDPIKAKLRDGQRLLLVPGGADPWRQDPACFENYANREPTVVAVLPFIWQSGVDGSFTYVGIRDNPTKALYVETGKRIKG